MTLPPVPPDPRPAPPPPETTEVRRRGPVARWFHAWMGSRYAYPALFFGVLIESTVFPWPVELMIASMMLENRRHVWPVWAVTVIATVLGAALAYLVGAYLFESLGRSLIDGMGWQSAYEVTRQRFQDYGFVLVLIAAQTPVPFQITALAAGVTGVEPAGFLLAALLGRSFRYALMAVPVFLFGPALKDWWLGSPPWVRWGLIGLGVAVFLMSLGLPFVT